ncbi:MAG: phosphatidylglycerophosphatase A [Pyrinomonadaceae bacterium]
MKTPVEKRKPSGIVDYVALALTTFAVGYGPIAPGTWGSAVGVGIYLVFRWFETGAPEAGSGAGLGSILALLYYFANSSHFVLNAVLLPAFCLIGIWAAGRSIPLLGNEDPSEAVVDEVMGQLVTFCFVPFGISWPFVLLGFLLFRAFDIWKPYPVRDLEVLPGGLGICADDLVAGVYAGICLAVAYAVFNVI